MIIRRVTGRSMLPVLAPGSIIFASKRELKAGNTVIAMVQGQEVVKRIGALHEDSVYLVGDNELESTDSREYGAIQKSDILATVMITFPTATPAPALTKPYGSWVGLAAAIVMIVFALVHLFRIDTFVPELSYTFLGGYGVAEILAVLIVTSEVFAVPFLLRMQLSPLARFSSAILCVIVPLTWLLISVWSLGSIVSTAQLGEFYNLPSSYVLVIANLLWLGLNCFALWALGFAWPQRLKKKL